MSALHGVRDLSSFRLPLSLGGCCPVPSQFQPGKGGSLNRTGLGGMGDRETLYARVSSVDDKISHSLSTHSMTPRSFWLGISDFQLTRTSSEYAFKSPWQREASVLSRGSFFSLLSTPGGGTDGVSPGTEGTVGLGLCNRLILAVLRTSP